MLALTRNIPRSHRDACGLYAGIGTLVGVESEIEYSTLAYWLFRSLSQL
jgi:hypothetical protein